MAAGGGGGGSLVTRFIRERYAPTLLHPRGKLAVLLLFSALSVGATLQLQHVVKGQPWQEYLPADSYLLHFIAVQDTAFARTGADPVCLTNRN